jgi:hypothetical protein
MPNQDVLIAQGTPVTQPRYDLALGNWAQVQCVVGSVPGLPSVQTGPNDTGVLGIVMVPQQSGIFFVSVRAAWSDGTTAGVITHRLRTKQGATNGALLAVAPATITNGAKFGILATNANARGIVTQTDAAGGPGFSFEGGSLVASTQVQHIDITASLTGLLTAQAAGGAGGAFAWSGYADANGASSLTKLPFTLGLPCIFHMTVSATAAHVITYQTASLFVQEVPLG